jgi:hypothetical protein
LEINGTVKEYHGQPPSIETFRYTVPLGAVKNGTLEERNTILWDDAILLGGDRSEYVIKFWSDKYEIVSQYFHNSVPVAAAGPANYFQLTFGDESLARRVLAAFRHAADLCRQKEPF